MINIPGQLAIRTISGRNGEFNVGRLSTSIGEFVIKDALLDQYDEGKYRGDFLITEIRPSYYSTAGRLIVEIRARLESMSLDDVDNLTPEDAARLSPNEPDPMDEESSSNLSKPVQRNNPPALPATNKQVSKEDAPFGMTPTGATNDLEADAELFGTIWPLSYTVRLDTTVDRQQLRQQCSRLSELGYLHNFKLQMEYLQYLTMPAIRQANRHIHERLPPGRSSTQQEQHMNLIFNNLTQQILENIEDQLANNEVSTNEELWDFFVEELEMTAEQADGAVALRPKYLGQIFLTGHSPLFQNETV